MLGEAREEPVQIMAIELPREGSGGLFVTLLWKATRRSAKASRSAKSLGVRILRWTTEK